MQTVSVRIPEDDLAWLAGLDLPAREVYFKLA